MLWEVDVHLRQNDPATQDLIDAANDLGLTMHTAQTATGWLIEGDMSLNEVQEIGTCLFTDPVTEVCRVAKAGDEVLITSRSFIASASSIALLGGIPVWCDVDLNSQNISLDEILKKTSKKRVA